MHTGVLQGRCVTLSVFCVPLISCKFYAVILYKFMVYAISCCMFGVFPPIGALLLNIRVCSHNCFWCGIACGFQFHVKNRLYSASHSFKWKIHSERHILPCSSFAADLKSRMWKKKKRHVWQPRSRFAAFNQETPRNPPLHLYNQCLKSARKDSALVPSRENPTCEHTRTGTARNRI